METEEKLAELANKMKIMAAKLDIGVGTYAPPDPRDETDGYIGKTSLNPEAVATLIKAAESLEAWTLRSGMDRDAKATRALLEMAADALSAGKLNLKSPDERYIHHPNGVDYIDPYDTGVKYYETSLLKAEIEEVAANFSHSLAVNLKGPEGPEVYMKPRIERRSAQEKGRTAEELAR